MNYKKFFTFVAFMLFCSYIDVWAGNDTEALLKEVGKEYGLTEKLVENG